MQESDFNKRFTITDVASQIGISSKTIMRWEKSGRIKKPKRDWRGWRVYSQEELDIIRNVHDALFDVD